DGGRIIHHFGAVKYGALIEADARTSLFENLEHLSAGKNGGRSECHVRIFRLGVAHLNDIIVPCGRTHYFFLKFLIRVGLALEFEGLAIRRLETRDSAV